MLLDGLYVVGTWHELRARVDAVAYRVDEIASSDERALLDVMKKDLLDLARYVDERIDARLSDR